MIQNEKLKSSKLKKYKVSFPFTPVRRLLAFVRGPSSKALGKRSRSRAITNNSTSSVGGNQSNYSPHLELSKGCPNHSPDDSYPPPMSVALQHFYLSPNHTTDLSSPPPTQQETSGDGIIVTTLPRPPFCCHAHLCALPLTDLVKIAEALNEKLPEGLRIEFGGGRDVREGIEKVVGLKREVPGAPMISRSISLNAGRNRSQSQLDAPGAGSGISEGPLSPLASKSRAKGLFTSLSMGLGLGAQRVGLGLDMGMVEEAEEDTEGLGMNDDEEEGRHVQTMQRTTGDGSVSSRPFQPSSWRVSNNQPKKPLLVRSQSDRLGQGRGKHDNKFIFDPTFISSAPRYQPRRDRDLHQVDMVQTSTPKRSRAYTTSSAPPHLPTSPSIQPKIRLTQVTYQPGEDFPRLSAVLAARAQGRPWMPGPEDIERIGRENLILPGDHDGEREKRKARAWEIDQGKKGGSPVLARDYGYEGGRLGGFSKTIRDGQEEPTMVRAGLNETLVSFGVDAISFAKDLVVGGKRVESCLENEGETDIHMY
ncbi:hypothetical protein JAAARDRAFT_59924 [Jaapia argillacea MUCL 33604]|uniref:Uncharacterized protein n=1 Tax=Jaapia argillacea MUCL 33604 TaxID=933084 RepID=A0A067PVV1_9AGAM|nr:hypothetical protein JAAARDRAFT_59924 [Jaapia argillacea MUCL 33604]